MSTSEQDKPAAYGDADLTRHPLAPVFDASESSRANDGYEPLVGFVGDAPTEGWVRVYASLTFRTYVEVRTADIAHSAPVDADDAEGPSVLRVPTGTQLQFVRTNSLKGDASFVLGTIRSAYYSRAKQASSDSADAKFVPDEMLPPYPLSEVYPPCHPPPPITPVLYCLSEVYPPC
jgi:hypothetical protein